MSEPPTLPEQEAAIQPVNRRGFFKYVLLGFSAAATAGGVAWPVVGYLWPPKQAAAAGGGRVTVGSTVDLPVGKGQVYSVNNKPVIVIHLADGFKALSATCTHLGCIVAWDEQKGVLSCPCHAAYFSTNGDVISGPPPAPLTAYKIQVEGDQIFVEGGEG